MNELMVGSLFSGIGGFDLGFERAGMRTVWFCEQDEFCQRVLAKHWPGVPCFPDVRALVADSTVCNGIDVPGVRGALERQAGRGLAGDDGLEGRERRVPVPVPHVDVLCGGFPCQDISLAGKGAGIGGARSGLWSEFARLVGELRPRYVVVENVPALLGRGVGRVLGDLAALGFDAEWDCLPASAFGAPHRRDRFWLVAYPNTSAGDGTRPAGEAVSRLGTVERSRRRGGSAGDIPDPDRPSGEGQRVPVGPLQDADERALLPWRVGGRAAQAGGSEWWSAEPPVGRVAHGVPDRLDQLAALGNSLVPQIAEWIGHRIVSYEVERGAKVAA